MKVNNYLVTASDLATMGYTPKEGVTPPTGGGIMNKGEANFYYRMYNGSEPWNSYPDNRCPKYQDFPIQCYASVEIQNTLEGNPDPVDYTYQDCSGNTYYGSLPFSQAVVIVGCAPSGETGPTTGCGILAGSVVAGGCDIIYGSKCDTPVECTTTTTTTTTTPPSNCYIVQGYVDGYDLNNSYNFEVCFDWYNCSGELVTYCTAAEGGFTLPYDCYDINFGATYAYTYPYAGGPKIGATYSYIDGTNPCGDTPTTTTTTTTQAPIGNVPFNAVAISDNTGQYQLAGNALKASTWQQGYLYVSNDYGVTFTKKNILGYWESVSVSGDGQYMLAVEFYGRAYRSSDYGVTWTAISNLSGPTGYPVSALQTLYFRGTAISQTGQIQYICTKDIYYGSGYYFALVFKSSDYGATWTTIKTINASTVSVTLSSVATSSNGQYVYVASGDTLSYGSILVSNNAGSIWTETAGGVGNILDVSTTPDGEFVFAARFRNDNYTYLLSSTNYGVSFSNITGTNSQDFWVKTCIQQESSPTNARGYALPSTNTLNTVVKSTSLFASSPINISNTTSPSIKWRDIAVQRTSDRVLAASTTGLYRTTNPVSGTWTKIT